MLKQLDPDGETMANTGKSEMTALEKKEYDELVSRVAEMPSKRRKFTMLSAIEASVLLKISIGTLDRARSKRRDLEQAGERIPATSHASIPFARSGDEGPVQYFAQDIVKFLKRLRKASDSTESLISAAPLPLNTEGIRCWLATANATDTWPFSIQPGGRPLDFMDAISQNILTGDARRLTLREFGNQLGDAAAAASALKESVALGIESDAALKDDGSGEPRSRRSIDGAL
jgi:hypothetical protein